MTGDEIQQSLDTWHDKDNLARQRFEQSQERWDRALQPLDTAIVESTHITERDLQLVIVCKDSN